MGIFKEPYRSSHRGSVVNNPTRNHEVAGGGAYILTAVALVAAVRVGSIPGPGIPTYCLGGKKINK